MTNPTEAPMANAIDDVKAWLAELSGERPQYACLTNDSDEHFTTDNLKALRFSRSQDAQAFIDYHGWTEVHPVEHMWIDAAKHDWFEYHGMTCCRKCGNVRNETSDQRPCKGSVKVGLRASPVPSQHTGWSDEAVEALAISVFDQTSDNYTVPWDKQPGRVRSQTRKHVRQVLTALRIHQTSALTAASSIAPATGFEVKALEWVDMGEGPRCITICGMYAISPSSGAYGRPTLTLTGMPGDLFGKFDTLDQAKARAQADFDSRIRSSISPSVAKESGEP